MCCIRTESTEWHGAKSSPISNPSITLERSTRLRVARKVQMSVYIRIPNTHVKDHFHQISRGLLSITGLLLNILGFIIKINCAGQYLLRVRPLKCSVQLSHLDVSAHWILICVNLWNLQHWAKSKRRINLGTFGTIIQEHWIIAEAVSQKLGHSRRFR